MRELLELKEEELIFFDIETAPVEKELKIDTPLYDSWEYKVNKDGKKESAEIIESYSNEAGLYPEFAKIISIVVGSIYKGSIYLKTFDHEDEKELLTAFNKALGEQKNKKKRLTGFVNIGFDTPFVFKRMLINGISPNKKVDSSGLKPWEVDEVDLGKIWQGTSFNRASLINISTAFGLPSPKDDINGSDVGRVYWNEENGLDRISKYCARDVETTINIFRKMCLRDTLLVSNNTIVKYENDEIANNPIIVDLFDGARYTKQHKDKLTEFVKELSDSERQRAFTILESVVSGARGKKTKFTKAHIKALKEKI